MNIQYDGKEIALTFKSYTHGIQRKVEPLFKALDKLPAQEEEFNALFLEYANTNPAIFDLAEKVKSGEVDARDAAQQGAEIENAKRQIIAQCRQNLQPDLETMTLCLPIFQAIIETKDLPAPLVTGIQSTDFTSPFYDELLPVEVVKVITNFRQTHRI